MEHSLDDATHMIGGKPTGKPTNLEQRKRTKEKKGTRLLKEEVLDQVKL